MLRLSYSTINNCLQPDNSHNWLNKQMGFKPEERWYWKAGREGHRIIQAHLCGKQLNMSLSTNKLLEDLHFPIVEEKDFDPRCKFEFSFKHNGKKTNIIGFHDGRTKDYSKTLEIKLSSNPWGISRFKRSFQRKLYALSNNYIKEQILVTGRKKPDLWEKEPLKVYRIPVTDKDRQDAAEWIEKAIDLFQSGDFNGGLNENGICEGYCYYGKNCQFK